MIYKRLHGKTKDGIQRALLNTRGQGRH